MKTFLKNIHFFKLIIVLPAINVFLGCTTENTNKIPSANEVLKITEKVANWQTDHKITGSEKSTKASKNYRLSDLHWSKSVLYTGMFQLSKVSHYPKYINWLIEIGEKNKWKIHSQKMK